MCECRLVSSSFFVIVIEPERALKYTNFFLRGVTVIVMVTKYPFLLTLIVILILLVIVIVILIVIMIVIVTTHPFLLPSIGQPHSQLVSLVDWASIRFSNESKKYQRPLCQI